VSAELPPGAEVPPSPGSPGTPGTPGGVHGAPRLPSWLVPRPHLVARLEDAAPVTVLRAPAGGGKTVLAAEWARTTGHRGVWVAVDGTHGRGFWGRVVQAVADAGLPSTDHPFAAGTTGLREARDLRGHLVRGFALLGPVVLVLDGADGLDDATAADVVHLVEAVPTLRVLATTRSPGPLESPAARLRVDVDVLTGADLVLTVAETARVLAGGSAGSPADAVADPADAPSAATVRVHGATGGSPLAVRLVALADGEPAHDARRTLEQVVTTAVDGLDGATADLVRTAAAADVLTPDLLAELAGCTPAQARERLDDLAALGLGTWTDPARGGFACTPVVRDALRARLRRTDPAGFRRLRARVAAWCDAHGLPVEALHAAVDSDDLDLVTAVARRHWRSFLLENVGTVRPALRPVNLLRLRRRPLLLFLLALGFNADPSGRLRAVALFGLAAASARVEGERTPPADRVLLRTIEVVALRLTGRGRAAARAAADVVRRADALTETERARVADVLPQSYVHAGTAFLYDARGEEAVHAFEQGVAAGATPPAQLPGIALLAGTLALDGAMPRARQHALRVRSGTWPAGLVDGYAGAPYRVAEAFLALEDLDPHAAQPHLDALARHLPTIEHWPLIAHAQAYTDLLRDGAETALARLDDTLRAHAQRQPAHRPAAMGLDATRATLLVAAGRPLAALELLPRTPDDPACVVAEGRAHLAAGRPDVALETLARTGAARRAALRTRADQALLEAVALLALDRAADASAALRRAHALLTVHELRLPLALLPADARSALARLAREHGPRGAVELLDEPSPAVVPAAEELPALTPREAVVLRALARTGSSAQIAADLVVSQHTVKSQLRSLYRKLDASSRTEALAQAGRLGLLPGDVPTARGPQGRDAAGGGAAGGGASGPEDAADAPPHR
jgi:LuxR family maltose regulon positive regulatory protein